MGEGGSGGGGVARVSPRWLSTWPEEGLSKPKVASNAAPLYVECETDSTLSARAKYRGHRGSRQTKERKSIQFRHSQENKRRHEQSRTANASPGGAVKQRCSHILALTWRCVRTSRGPLVVERFDLIKPARGNRERERDPSPSPQNGKGKVHHLVVSGR